MACCPLTEDGRIAVACFKCSEGCIYLEYANMVLNLTQAQFLAFSEVITKPATCFCGNKNSASRWTSSVGPSS